MRLSLKGPVSRAVYISLEGALQAAKEFQVGYPHKLEYCTPRAVYGRGGHILGWGVRYRELSGVSDWIMEV